tara:strand:+ start:53 stop:553 length:501 start_codon:yes stop_codon:yes gene_type:complete
MSRASDLANLIASGSTTIFGEGGAPTTNAGQANQTGGTTNLQNGLAKFWTNYDAVNQVTRGSLNQSSLFDESLGNFYSVLTNPMSGAEDKCVQCTASNSEQTGGGSSVAGSGRGIDCAYGSHVTGEGRVFATNEVQFSSNYGATASSNGAFRDLVSTNVTIHGDLA